MEQIKRQSSNSFNNYDDNKRQKLQITTDETNCLSKVTVTYFEDLSNEVIYEIFEFLDYFHVYQAFFNLNIRFHSLLTNSNLPIKINLSYISKSAFQHYNTDIIQTNMHRIHSLCFSDVIMYNSALSSIYKLSEFDRVETLILHNIEHKCLENLLNQLTSLSLLSSLVITSADTVRNKNTIYRQIFRLSALKYCKLSLLGWSTSELLPVSTDEYSSIEHLIITNDMYFHQLYNLLSYVPQLRRSTFHLQPDTWEKPTKICPFVLNRLTHISFRLHSIKFDQFEQVCIDLLPTVQVLHLRLTHNAGQAYMDANKWKQLISSHTPNLRIFDIQLDIAAGNKDDQLRMETQINQFASPFWIERQWFFTHQFCRSTSENRLIFYSTNPYRRKQYTLYKQSDDTYLNHYESNLDSVQHVHIQSEKVFSIV